MLMSYHLLYRQFTGTNPQPQGSRHTAFAPYGAYPAADGTILIGISSDGAFRRLAEALGRPRWSEDARFGTNADRVKNTPELDLCLSEVLAAHPVAYWTEVLDRYDVANDPMQNPEQVMEDRQARALEQLERVELEGAGTALLPRLPIGLSLAPPAIQGPPPRVGQHTREILVEAGFTESEIEELLRGGVCAAGGESECPQ